MAKGPQETRYGGLRHGTPKVLRKGVTANESAPTLKAHGIDVDHFPEVKWLVLKPTWATSFDVHVMRYVEAGSGATAVAKWIEDEVLVGQTKDVVAFQYVVGDLVAIYLDNIAGVVGADGFTVIAAGVNRG